MPTLEVGPCESADAPGTGLGLVVLAVCCVDGVEKFSVQPPGQASCFSRGICIAHSPVLRVPKVGFCPW